MTTDFLDAHRRHWTDAEMLFTGSRWANADHLYGISAECGLKRLMIAFGMPLRPDGAPSSRHNRVHINEASRPGAWDRYESYRSGRPAAVEYVLPASCPFSNWDVSQRYAPQSQFDECSVEPHRAGADAVHRLVSRAIRDGLIT